MSPFKTPFRLESISESRLSYLDPDFAEAVRAAGAILATSGTWMRVVSGLRTAEEQDALYAQGRTAPGHVVTNARAGQSMHNYGLAADIVPFLSGSSGQLNWNVKTPQYQAMVAALKAQGLTWGGDWEGDLGDYDHFQVAGLPPTPPATLQAMYGDGKELPEIWNSIKTA